MWFPIFDKIHSMQQKYQKSTNMRLTERKVLQYKQTQLIINFCSCAVYTVMIHEVLNSMLGYVSLPDVLQKIIQVQ